MNNFNTILLLVQKWIETEKRNDRLAKLNHIYKSLEQYAVMKAARPIGYVSQRKDGKYKKTDDNEWQKIAEDKQNKTETQENIVSRQYKVHEKKGISNIHKYMTDELKKMGFDVETSGSGLSDSEYITINNWEEKTGKEGANKDGTLKIRISNHDLPPSYDRLHGYFDIDVMDGIKYRRGSEGNAESYVSALEKVAHEANENVPSHIIALHNQEKNEEAERKERQKASEKEKLNKEEKYKDYYSMSRDDQYSARKKFRKDLHKDAKWEAFYDTLLHMKENKRAKYYRENYKEIKNIENIFAEKQGLPPDEILSDMKDFV